DHLLESIWGFGPGLMTRTVDTHISRLRRKLGLTPENGWRLKAVYHQGYRLEQLEEHA
ncbi:MAG: helix-turn-helix domain-containing protein, partial [Candidatus Thiodiazotropha sp. (ex Lucinoma annulata)]|nr:helix-turn-helix domain-containing protein [Candidatus Thiodiazotropha sp. (ex Lucinoma annulata)]